MADFRILTKMFVTNSCSNDPNSLETVFWRFILDLTTFSKEFFASFVKVRRERAGHCHWCENWARSHSCREILQGWSHRRGPVFGFDKSDLLAIRVFWPPNLGFRSPVIGSKDSPLVASTLGWSKSRDQCHLGVLARLWLANAEKNGLWLGKRTPTLRHPSA